MLDIAYCCYDDEHFEYGIFLKGFVPDIGKITPISHLGGVVNLLPRSGIFQHQPTFLKLRKLDEVLTLLGEQCLQLVNRWPVHPLVSHEESTRSVSLEQTVEAERRAPKNAMSFRGRPKYRPIARARSRSPLDQAAWPTPSAEQQLAGRPAGSSAIAPREGPGQEVRPPILPGPNQPVVEREAPPAVQPIVVRVGLSGRREVSATATSATLEGPQAEVETEDEAIIVDDDASERAASPRSTPPLLVPSTSCAASPPRVTTSPRSGFHPYGVRPSHVETQGFPIQQGAAVGHTFAVPQGQFHRPMGLLTYAHQAPTHFAASSGNAHVHQAPVHFATSGGNMQIMTTVSNNQAPIDYSMAAPFQAAQIDPAIIKPPMQSIAPPAVPTEYSDSAQRVYDGLIGTCFRRVPKPWEALLPRIQTIINELGTGTHTVRESLALSAEMVHRSIEIQVKINQWYVQSTAEDMRQAFAIMLPHQRSQMLGYAERKRCNAINARAIYQNSADQLLMDNKNGNRPAVNVKKTPLPEQW